MMQATEPRYGIHLRIHRRTFCCFSTRRGLLVQSEMGSVIVVIANVLGHEPLEMAFIEHNYMVKQISTARTDEGLGRAIPPWALDTGSFGFYSEASDCLNNVSIEVAAPVKDKPPRCGIVGKRLSELLRYPCAVWMLCLAKISSADFLDCS